MSERGNAFKASSPAEMPDRGFTPTDLDVAYKDLARETPGTTELTDEQTAELRATLEALKQKGATADPITAAKNEFDAQLYNAEASLDPAFPLVTQQKTAVESATNAAARAEVETVLAQSDLDIVQGKIDGAE